LHPAEGFSPPFGFAQGKLRHRDTEKTEAGENTKRWCGGSVLGMGLPVGYPTPSLGLWNHRVGLAGVEAIFGV